MSPSSPIKTPVQTHRVEAQSRNPQETPRVDTQPTTPHKTTPRRATTHHNTPRHTKPTRTAPHHTKRIVMVVTRGKLALTSPSSNDSPPAPQPSYAALTSCAFCSSVLWVALPTPCPRHLSIRMWSKTAMKRKNHSQCRSGCATFVNLNRSLGSRIPRSLAASFARHTYARFMPFIIAARTGRTTSQGGWCLCSLRSLGWVGGPILD